MLKVYHFSLIDKKGMYWSGQGRQRLGWPEIWNAFVQRPKINAVIQGKTGIIENLGGVFTDIRF